MRKFVLSLMVLISGLMIVSPSVGAVNIFGSCTSGNRLNSTTVCKNITQQSPTGDPIVNIIREIINVFSFIIGIASVIVLIIAGLQMIIGGDDPQSVKSARDTLIYALVGIVVAVLAQSLVLFVLNKVS